MCFSRFFSPLPVLLVITALCTACGSDSEDNPAVQNSDSTAPAPQSTAQNDGDPFGNPATLPPSLPSDLIALPAGISVTATSLSFSPDGSRLYVAALPGIVFAMPVVGGVIAGPPLPFLTGLEMPLGVLATDDAVFVSVVQGGSGAVLRAGLTNGGLLGGTAETVISGLPIGRHNTNGLAMGPDGMLYVVNGNANDSGFRNEGGSEDVPPFSGSLLRLDPAATDLTPQPAMVVATGWRNVYDLAFVPEGHPSLTPGLAAVSMNGPDGMSYPQPDGSSKQRPVGEDTLSLLDVNDAVVEHFGFPWCLYDRDNGGLAGFAQDPEEGSCHPLPAAASESIPGPVEQAFPVALFGNHVSANGLAFNPGGNFPSAYDGDLFVAEFGNNPGGSDLFGHKIVRVRFDEAGNVLAVEDFMSGVVPLDLTFGPDGALWIADLTGVVLRATSLGLF